MDKERERERATAADESGARGELVSDRTRSPKRNTLGANRITLFTGAALTKIETNAVFSLEFIYTFFSLFHPLALSLTFIAVVSRLSFARVARGHRPNFFSLSLFLYPLLSNARSRERDVGGRFIFFRSHNRRCFMNKKRTFVHEHLCVFLVEIFFNHGRAISRVSPLSAVATAATVTPLRTSPFSPPSGLVPHATNSLIGPLSRIEN